MTTRVLLGRRPVTGVHGLYVSQPGVDVLGAGDGNLYFNSETFSAEQMVMVGVTGAGIFVPFPNAFSAPPLVLLGPAEGWRPFPNQFAGTDGYAAPGTSGFSMTYAGRFIVMKRSF